MNQPSISAIQYMGMIMSKQRIEIGLVLELVEILNHSYLNCQNVITILEDIYQHQKSAKILLAVQVLEYFLKNGNRNFHQAANRLSFQKTLLGLLKRMRGKSNFLKDLRSNGDNWNRIEAKVLYLIQLWYDAFILEENVYTNIIDSYKTLRKENIIFPPRSVNEKNILFVQTESPILENIEEIARNDHKKFHKTLNRMGMNKVSEKMQIIEQKEKKKNLERVINIDEISERIAIIRSNEYQGQNMLKLIEEVKKDLDHGKVEKHEQAYWKEIKQAAEMMIQEWEVKNCQLIQEQEKQYLENKLGRIAVKKQEKIEEAYHPSIELASTQKEQVNLLDL